VQLPVGVNKPHAVVFTNLPIDAEHANVGVVPEQRIGCDNAFARRPVIGKKSTDRPRPHLACEPHSIKWINNPAGEDQIKRSLKIIGILLKKWAFFGEENLKPLVDSDLRIIRFDLPKVGVDGGV
jgi:hypothetical protein